MLYIYTDAEYEKGCIRNVDGYFNRNKEKDWFNKDTVKEIIKGIDNTIAVKDEYLESPVFGGMSPERLSSGCKAVILMEVLDNKNIYATHCGDNCAKYILEVAKRKDVTITLHHCMIFPEGDFGVDVKMMSSGRIIRDRVGFIDEYYDCPEELRGVIECEERK